MCWGGGGVLRKCISVMIYYGGFLTGFFGRGHGGVCPRLIMTMGDMQLILFTACHCHTVLDTTCIQCVHVAFPRITEVTRVTWLTRPV